MPHNSVELAIPSDIFDRVLAKLGVSSKLTLDLAGLTRVYAAYSRHVPNDNIQKRIWLVGDRAKPLTGGDPIGFFVNWLEHGTGGTCFPANGTLCALLYAIGFNARRFSGAVLMEGLEHDGNHGTVIATIDGIDYLVDAQLASFVPLPLITGQFASTGNGIHDINAVPNAEGFDVHWYPGANRERSMIMRPDLTMGAVDHAYFLAQFALSVSRDRHRSPFNEALFVGRHFRGSTAHPAASNAGLGLRAALTAKNYNGRSPSDSGRSWDKQLL
jgi:arylamine N-acetyltransferase